VNETINFRLPGKQKEALYRLAAERDQPLSELVREVVETYLAGEERRAWEAEARRASLVLAEEAKNPESDEARMLKVLEANLDEFADEWVWDEES
jgi:hypothetical protein